MDATELGAGWFIHSLALTLYWDPLAKWGACSVARSSQSTTHYSYFGGPSSGTANPRQSCGRRRVTRSWWNCLCDRQFAAILRSTARCLQLENFRDSTLSQRSLCKWTRSPFIVSSRVALPTGHHPWSRQGCIEEWRNCENF